MKKMNIKFRIGVIYNTMDHPDIVGKSVFDSGNLFFEAEYS